MGTWVLFVLLSWPWGSSTLPLLHPLVLGLLLVSLPACAVFVARFHRTPLAPHAKVVGLACQMSLFLLHFVLQEQLSEPHPRRVLLLAGFVVLAWAVNLRFPGSRAFSGPAIVFVALDFSGGGFSEHLILAMTLGACTLILVWVHRNLLNLLAPMLATFFLVLAVDQQVKLISAIVAIVGLGIVYGLYRLVLMSQAMDQYRSALVDLVAWPGVVLLARSLLEDPQWTDTALWVFLFFTAKLALLLVGFMVVSRGQRRTAGEAGPKPDSQARRKGRRLHDNLWFTVLGSTAVTAVSFANYVFSQELSLVSQLLHLGAGAILLYFASRWLNRRFLGAFRLGPVTATAFLRRRYDSKILRFSALVLLALAMVSALSPFAESNYTEQLLASATAAADNEALSDVVADSWAQQAWRGQGLANGEFARAFIVFTLLFVVLLIIADGELDPPPFFFLRGLVPARTLFAIRDRKGQISRLVFSAPLIGFIARGFSGLISYFLKSFEDEVGLSVGKWFVMGGSLIFYYGAADFIDRPLMLAVDHGGIRLPSLFAASVEGAKDLVVWRSSCAAFLTGLALYAAGVLLRRTYLRAIALMLSSAVLMFNVFRVGNLPWGFPMIFACGLFGVCALLWYPVRDG